MDRLQKRIIMLLVLCAAALLFGCVMQSAEPSQMPPATPSSTVHMPEVTPKYRTAYNSWTDPNIKRYTLGDSVYYLDDANVLSDGVTTGYMLCCEIGGVPKDLDFLAIDITSYGESIYLLVRENTPEDSFIYTSDRVYRIDSEGNFSFLFVSGSETYRSIDYALIAINDSLFFTMNNEPTLYKADLNFSNIERVPLINSEEDPMKTCKEFSKSELYHRIDLFVSDNGEADKELIVVYEIIDEEEEYHYYCEYIFSAKDDSWSIVESVYHSGFTEVGEYLYYLDLNNPITSDMYELPYYEIKRRNNNNGKDERLGVFCFRFEIIGDFIYADKSPEYGDFFHWESYRYNLDGTDEMYIEYSDMRRYYSDGKIYFTLFIDPSVYITDVNIDAVKKLDIVLPDAKKIDSDLSEYHNTIGDICFVTVTKVEGNWIEFIYEICETDGSVYYSGKYRINMKTEKVEKMDDAEVVP